MHRTTLQQHLAQSEDHIALGGRNIAHQRTILPTLERDCHDTTEAKKLLATFEETQMMRLATRKVIRRELAAINQNP